MLNAIASFRVPVGEKVRGGFRAAGGETIFWTDRDVWRWRDSSTGSEKVCPSRVRKPLWAGFVGSVLTVLDTAGSGLALIEGSSRCTTIRTLPFPDVTAATATDSGWLIIEKHGTVADPTRLQFVPHNRHRSIEERHLPFAVADSGREWLFVSPREVGATLGNRRWPFQWVPLDATGNAIMGPVSAGVDEMLAFGANTERWLALPLLDLGGGYLQMLVDLGSDHRIFRILDRDGHRIKQRNLILPIGFFASDPSTHQLVGLRTTSVSDLVVYGWRWDTNLQKE